MSSPSSPPLDDVKDAAKQLGKSIDETMSVISHGLAQTVSATYRLADEGSKTARVYLDIAQGYLQQGVGAVKSIEDTAVDVTKDVILYTANNPYLAYPSLATLGLLVLPGTRRLLYRMTIGQFVSAEGVIKNSESKVESMRSRITDYTLEAQKLEERMLSAEEELRRSYRTLKGARLELQRLAGNLSSSHNIASGVVRDLRQLKKVDASLAIRGEAAQQAADLKRLLGKVRSNVSRIVNQDI